MRIQRSRGKNRRPRGESTHTHHPAQMHGTGRYGGYRDDGESRQTPSDVKPEAPAARRPAAGTPATCTKDRGAGRHTQKRCENTPTRRAKHKESTARARSRRAPLRGTLPVVPRGVQRGGPAAREALHQSSAPGSTARKPGNRGCKYRRSQLFFQS
jgi:hypothetical protein